MNTIKFEVGKTYTTRSICDSDSVFSGKVVRRTASTITFDVAHFGIRTVRIIKDLSEIEGCECARPLGRYSFSPIFKAA